MSNLLWRFGFFVAVGSLIWILHRYIGIYPDALPRSEKPSTNIRPVLFLWEIAVIFPVLRKICYER
jgi:hypothetical protein